MFYSLGVLSHLELVDKVCYIFKHYKDGSLSYETQFVPMRIPIVYIDYF
jgi:hypothetical protein